MPLETRLLELVGKLRGGHYANEQSISQGVVLPVLNELEWDVFDTTTVWPEFATGEGRVDFALCDPPSKPKCFVEVKQPGKAEGGIRQALEYAFHTGVQFVVLTDGGTWSFYLPAEQGSYEDRRVFKLDLLEHDSSQSATILRRYLNREDVVSGVSLESARKEYRDKSRRGVAREAIPGAWHELVAKGDDLLTDLIAEAVESKAGVRPDDDDIADFLLSLGQAHGPQIAKPGSSVTPANKTLRHPTQLVHGTLTLRGKSCAYASAKEAMLIVLETLARDDPTFLERCSRHREFNGRKRRHIAKTLEDLYPGRPDLQESHHDSLPGGWLVGTNLNNPKKMALIKAAAEVGGLVLGKDIVIDF